MTIDEKYALALDMVIKLGVENDKDSVFSIASCVKDNRVFLEYFEGKVVLFLTWVDSSIDGKRYIFINNLWIDKSYRSPNTLVRVRTALRYLLGNVYKFYGHDKKKDKVVYRS